MIQVEFSPPPGRLRLTQATTAAVVSLAMSRDAANPAEVTPERFGAVGDGVHDDSAALAAAIATGLPVRLGARTDGIAGQFAITVPAVREMSLRHLRHRRTCGRLAKRNGSARVLQCGQVKPFSHLIFSR